MSEKKHSNGIGLGTVLFLIFLVLKLTKHIDWSWWCIRHWHYCSTSSNFKIHKQKMTKLDRQAALKLLEAIKEFERKNCQRLLAIQAKLYNIKYN